jgi:hypothetical protein
MVAKRYATLPSQVLKMGNTIDIRCALMSLQYENYLNNKVSGKSAPVPELTQEQMLDMMNKVRGKNSDESASN